MVFPQFLHLDDGELKRSVSISHGSLSLCGQLGSFTLLLLCLGFLLSDHFLGFVSLSLIDLQLLHHFERIGTSLLELRLHLLQHDLDFLNSSIGSNQSIETSLESMDRTIEILSFLREDASVHLQQFQVRRRGYIVVPSEFLEELGRDFLDRFVHVLEHFDENGQFALDA
jgi:hypothetical protein